MAPNCPLGPAHCLHEFYVSPAAARVFVFAADGEEAACPLVPLARLHEARRRIAALAARRLQPADLLGAGVTAALLAACGFTADEFVTAWGYETEDFLTGLRIDWPSLRLLGWKPSLLRDRRSWPVIALQDKPVGLRAGHLLAEWPLAYAMDVAHCLTLSEVAVLCGGGGVSGPDFLRCTGARLEALAGQVARDGLNAEALELLGLHRCAGVLREQESGVPKRLLPAAKQILEIVQK